LKFTICLFFVNRDGTIKFFVDEENSVKVTTGEKPDEQHFEKNIHEMKHEKSKTHERHGPLTEKQSIYLQLV